MSSADTLQTRPLRAAPKLIVDLAQVDLSGQMLSREDLEKWIPHRDRMALLDGVVWHTSDF